MLPGVGVFGCGQLVHLLVPSLRAKGFSVEALWGVNLVAAEECANRLAIPFFTDHMDTVLLKSDVQLICVACPPHLHAQIVTKALNIGKHVLCDWPAALNAADIAKMVSAATYYPSLISILCHPLRFLTAFQQMKRLILAGDYLGEINIINVNVSGDRLLDLGDLYTVKCDNHMGGGLLTNVGSHIIDIITFATNLKAKRVHGILKTFSCDLRSTGQSIRRLTIDDFCNFQMEMEVGNKRDKSPSATPSPLALVTLNSHRSLGQFNHEVIVFGTRGYLAVREGSLYGKKYQQNQQKLSPNKAGEGIDGETALHLDEDLMIDKESQLLSLSPLPKPYVQGMVKLISTLRNAFQSNPDSPVKKAQVEKTSDAQGEDADKTQQQSLPKETPSSSDKVTSWFKEAVSLAANFEDGEYIQACIEAIKQSSENKEWVRVKYNIPNGPSSPSRKVNGV